MESRNCNYCNETILGRADKKFCDDQCRSAFNNKLNGQTNNQIRQVNNVLKRNRNILENLFKENRAQRMQVVERKIKEMGFVFHFHTHIEKHGEDNICFCCYDYGYIYLNQEECAIIKLK